MKKLAISFLMFMLASMGGMAQKQFIQEQVHVMTDRELYMPSDTIWLNAWVVKAATKQKANYSNYLYVELRDAGGFLQKRVRLRAAAPGKFTGFLPLSEKLASNTYTLVAYTYHMLCADETLFFKKPIDIITPRDMNNGITLKNLRNRKETENFKVVRGDSVVSVDFDVPEGGQYAASVTNVSMNPTDSTSFITNTLPYMPLLYTKRKAPDAVLSFPFEQGSVVSGTVYGNFFTKKPQKNVDVSLVGISEKYYDKMKTDDKGHFLFNVPDIYSADDIAGYMVQAKSKHTVKDNITFDTLSLPKTLKTFIPGKDHFVHISKQEVADDKQKFMWASDKRYSKTIMLDEVNVKGYKQNSRTYNVFADRSFAINDEYGMKVHNFRELAPYLGLRVEYDGVGVQRFMDLSNLNNADYTTGARSGVSVYVNDIEIPDYDITQLDAMFPMEWVLRVDKLSPTGAMALTARGFQSNTVVNIILKNADEMALTNTQYTNFCIAKQMACQKQAEFKLTETPYAPPVLYWNPSVSQTQADKATVVFRTPDAPRSTYRIMLEGITDTGTPIHQEKYIKIAE